MDESERRCRSCTACCSIPAIPELNKPAWTDCVHLGALPNGMRGCTIYETRPEPCRAFVCAWKQGYGSRGDRPDQLGVMLTSEQAEDPAVGETAKLYETHHGASSRPRVGKMIRDLLERKRVLVVIAKRNADGSLDPIRDLRIPEHLRGHLTRLRRLLT